MSDEPKNYSSGLAGNPFASGAGQIGYEQHLREQREKNPNSETKDLPSRNHKKTSAAKHRKSAVSANKNRQAPPEVALDKEAFWEMSDWAFGWLDRWWAQPHIQRLLLPTFLIVGTIFSLIFYSHFSLGVWWSLGGFTLGFMSIPAFYFTLRVMMSVVTMAFFLLIMASLLGVCLWILWQVGVWYSSG